MSSRRLPDGYLELCSLDALESLVLARINQAAIFCTQAKQVLQQWVEVEAEVKVARWMLDQRRSDVLRDGAAAQMQAAQSGLAFQSAVLPAVASSPHAAARFALVSNSLHRQCAPSQPAQGSLPIASDVRRLHLRHAGLAIRVGCGGPTKEGGAAKLPGSNRSPGCVRTECSLAHDPPRARIMPSGRHLPAAS